ncbi:MAG: FG-GAP-like repeat-containing protein [Acidobacteriota bacterium]
MKRPLLLLGAAFLILAAVITVFRLRRAEETAAGTTKGGQEEQIRTFWAQYQRATRARLEGDFRSAALAYREALALDPQHQDSLFYLAVCLQESGRYNEAAELLRNLTQIYPEHNRAFSQLGAVLSTVAPGSEPDFEGAAAAFARSQEINREHSGPFVGQGSVALNRGDLERAAEYFAVAADMGAPEGTFLAGLTRYLQGRYRKGAEMFIRVLEANARERKISGRGVTSEGDVQKEGGAGELNAFERSGLQSLLFLYWTARRLGGYPETVPESFRVESPARIATAPRFRSAWRASEDSARGVWLDHDRDGRLDLVVAARGGTRLLRNTSRGWVDVSRSAGLDGVGESWAGCPLDVDGDGWQDLYLLRGGYVGTGKPRLYRNAKGRFQDVTELWGLSGERATAACVASDVSGDGRTDLLEVGNATPDSPSVRLYINEGSRFVDRAGQLSLQYPTHGVDAAVADFDGDGRRDIFILGWKAPARLFRNTGSRFVDVTDEAGLQGVGGDGFSAIFFDYDGDQRPDLLVTSHASSELSLQRLLDPSIRLRRHTPRLFLNGPSGRFEEVTRAVGLDRGFGAMQAISADFDGDGWMDLLFAEGGLARHYLEPSVILRNRQGRELVEWAYLPSFDEPLSSLGAAAADVDGDGRPDVYLSGAGILLNSGS